MNLDRLRTLILNTDGRPMAVVSWKKAISLMMGDRLVQLDFYDGIKIHDGKGVAYPVPAVAMTRKYVRRNAGQVPFCRKNILIRDQLRCGYCGHQFDPRSLTMDHVVPRSKWKGQGSPTTWENIVACCESCNKRKADLTCEQAKMFPLTRPTRPKQGEIFLGLSPWRDHIPREWLPYLQNLPLFKGVVADSTVGSVHSTT